MLYSNSKWNSNNGSDGAKFPRGLCIIVVYVVGNVMDLFKLWVGGLCMNGRPQEIFVNKCFGICLKWKHLSNSSRGVPEQCVGRWVNEWKVDDVEWCSFCVRQVSI